MNATTPRQMRNPLAATSGTEAQRQARPTGTAGLALPVLLALAALQVAAWLALGQPVARGGAAAALGVLAVLPLTGWLRRRERPALLRPAGWLLAGGTGQLLAAGIVASAGWALEAGHAWPSGLLMLAVQAALLPLVMLQAFALAEALFGRSFRRRWAALPAPLGLPLPRISLHLPLHDADPAAVRDTLESLAALEHADFEVLVVDTSTDPAFWEPVADHCARRGPRFRFFHLGGAPEQPLAALDFALRESDPRAELLGLLRPGTVLRADWLRRMMPLFNRPGLGFAQGLLRPDSDAAPRWRDLALAGSRPSAAAAVAANERDGLLLDGGPALLRRAALQGAGGWGGHGGDQPAELSLRLLRQGWEGACIPEAMGHAPAPATATAWRTGLQACIASRLSVLRRHARALLNPLDRSLAPGQRRQLLAGWAPAFADALWLALAVLALLASPPLLARPGLSAPLLLLLPPVLLPLAFRLLRAAMLAAPGERARAMLADLASGPVRALSLWRGLLGLPQSRRGLDGAGWLAGWLWAMATATALLGRPGWAALLVLLSLPCLARLLLAWLGRRARDWAA
jgi:hypothetical protein